MGKPIDIVAQYSQDSFYGDFKPDSGFFTLDDFIFHCGSVLGEYYRQEFAAKYAELKADKTEGLVSFGDDLLNSEELTVKDGVAEIPFDFASFMYDTQASGIQMVYSGEELLERISSAQRWQLKHIPFVSRVFWYLDGKKIKLFSKGICNPSKINVFFVPGIGENMIVPDGLVQYVVETTVSLLRSKEGVVKETNDGNKNKIMESEINKRAIK